MKLFCIDHGWYPSGIETSVILAENKEEAIRIHKENGGGENTQEVPEILESHDDCYFSVEEKPLVSGHVYTGHFCC